MTVPRTRGAEPFSRASGWQLVPRSPHPRG